MKKIVLLILVIILLTGCGCSKKLKCPSDFSLDEESNKCMKITKRKAELELYCDIEEKRLEGNKCFWEQITNATLTYKCPEEYYLYGNECRKGIPDEDKCGANRGYLNGTCFSYVSPTPTYTCDFGKTLRGSECVIELSSIASTRYICYDDETLQGSNCNKTEIVDPK